MRHFIFMSLFLVLLSSCANRGYTISQQMPGYDNKLNPIPSGVAYKIDQLGQIYDTQDQGSSDASRGIASIQNSTINLLSENFITTASTLDPEGAFFLGKSSAQVIIKKTPSSQLKSLH